MNGRTENFFPNIITYREANKGSDTGWKHQDQNLLGWKKGGVTCLDTNSRRWPKRAGVENEW